ncbi:MAG: alcohol dehydrogenase catalytic domain-containing protein [Geodermatophilaceae bacterium]|nr:alcohol dehydrogenase catalytic domain-containing protein [Geodermatophilaceae bacterium]
MKPESEAIVTHGHGSADLLEFQAGLRTPKRSILGTDVAGRVEAVGANVTRFQPGEDVFGVSAGSFTESSQAPDALRYLEQGVAQGKIVIASGGQGGS